MNELNSFAAKLAPHIYRIAAEKGFPEYICGIIIAQAYYQSNNNTSELATKYFNFFNIKATSSWNGMVLVLGKNNKYKEVKKSLLPVKNGFRGYNSLKEGIEGYFDFLCCGRYSNIKKSTSGKDYLEKLKADGYAIDDYKAVYELYHANKLDDYNYKELKKKLAPQPSKALYTVPRRDKIKNTVNKQSYLPKYEGSSTSIINALLEIGYNDTSKDAREKLAKINDIPINNEFNVKLLELLKEGKLKYE